MSSDRASAPRGSLATWPATAAISTFDDNVLVDSVQYAPAHVLCSTPRATYYEGTAPDGARVVFKAANDGVGPRQLARLRHERNVLARLVEVDVVPRVRSLQIITIGYMLVLDAVAHRPLHQRLGTGRLTLIQSLQVGIGAARALGILHAAGVAHFDINPHSIWTDAELGAVKLFELDLATLLGREACEPKPIDSIEGTLAYLAPEQTGRMNRAADFRADFYALGATLYELITGTPPFTASTPLDYIHAHIACQPVPPSELDPSIPPALATLILSLLAKTPEARYQSSFALVRDLEACLGLVTGTRASVVLNQHDTSALFRIPETLYGRETELEELLGSFARARQGSSEMALITGSSGMGKTALVGEIHQTVCAHSGYFISGKFEQLQRDVPYTSLIQAFRSLVAQLLAESDARISEWKPKLQKALGQNAAVVTAVIPDLELILGPQPAVESLDAKAAQQRFNTLFLALVGVFARPEHPLVLFFDDLQWADSASLELIRLMATEQRIKHVLHIGAYRESEVGPAYPVAQVLARMDKEGARIHRIQVEPLSSQVIASMLADTLQTTAEEVTPLAGLLEHKTAGNPFFFKQMLYDIYERGLVWFNALSGRWGYDMQGIEALDLTSNVLELLAQGLDKLPPATLRVLELGACIGTIVNLTTLAHVSGGTPHEVAQALWPALERDLMRPLGTDYQLIADDQLPAMEVGLTIEVRYAFVHDRIQQAAYVRIAESERVRRHLQIGQVLLARAGGPDRIQECGATLFDVTSHLNQGSMLITSDEERLQLARLNLLAGRRAKASMAYGAALRFLRAGTSLLIEESWTRYGPLARELYLEQAEAEDLNTHFDQAEAILAMVLDRTADRHARAEILAQQARHYTNRGKLTQALEIGLAALRLYDLHVPFEPQPDQVRAAVERTLTRLAEHDWAALETLPRMTDPTSRMLIKVVAQVSAAAFFVNRNLLHLLCTKIVELTLRHGVESGSISGFGNLATHVIADHGQVQLGYRLGMLALTFAEALNQRDLRGRAHFLVGCFHAFWKRPLREAAEHLYAGYQHNHEIGNLLYACYAAGSLVPWNVFAGCDLDECLSTCNGYLSFAREAGVAAMADYLAATRKLILSLRGEHTGDTEELQQRARSSMKPAIHWYLVMDMQRHYLLGNLTAAREAAEQARTLTALSSSMYWIAEEALYDVLIAAAIHEQTPTEARAEQLARMRQQCRKMASWAAECPDNFLHKQSLLQAEIARIDGADVGTILDAYEAAIYQARTAGFTNMEALASERASRFFGERGNASLAVHYALQARRAYGQWGATAKADEVDAVLQLLGGHEPLLAAAPVSATPAPIRNSDLDLSAVLQFAQMLSSEIEPAGLLTRLLHILMACSGAQYGYVVRDTDGMPYVHAIGVARDNRVELLKPVELASYGRLSQSLVHYVQRTRKSVIVDDAAQSSPLPIEPAIIERGARSLWCAPMTHQGKLQGVVYLENTLSNGVFTAERSAVLESLATQAAISLANAHYMSQLQEKIRLEVQLQDAQAVQAALLPQRHDIPGVDIATYYAAAERVGGDWYGIFHDQVQQRLYVHMGDVTGHGMPSALVTGAAAGAITAVLSGLSAARRALVPRECLELVATATHEAVRHAGSLTGRTMTMMFLCMDLNTGHCTYLNAGHNPAFWARSRELSVVTAQGYVLGSADGLRCGHREFVLMPGDCLLLYTDGLLENSSSDGRTLKPRMLRSVLFDDDADRIKQRLLAMARAIWKEHPADDDCTFLILRRNSAISRPLHSA